MPAAGVFWYECSRKEPRPRKKRAKLPRCDPRTARRRMGKRKRPFHHQKDAAARAKREKRWRWTETEQIAQSQMLVAKRRLASNTYYGPNADEVRREARGLPAVTERAVFDDPVRFVPPGPRRSRGLGCGFLLRLIGTNWVAVVRRRRGDPLRLDQVFVVPRSDCFMTK